MGNLLICDNFLCSVYVLACKNARMILRSAAIVFGILLSTSLALKAQDEESGESLQKLHRLFSILDEHYVDDYNTQKVTEEAIRAILKELDPHSNYLTAEELQTANENLSGSFEGVGITYNNDDDTLLIISTQNDGPADKAGICPGDRIVFVDDSLIAGIGISSARLSRLLRGKKGSTVVLKVLREERADTLVFKVKRDKIPVESVTASYLIDEETGLVKITRFGAQTAEDMKEAIKKLRKSGMRQLILDLRGNPGGYLHVAVDMCSEFFAREELVVFTEGKESRRKDYFSKGKGIFEEGKLAVLIDENSASASEIVSGAIQDLDRGIIIGRRSYGKGLVQNTYSFSDGSAARITTARYYTPSGRCIQRPYNEGKDKYNEELKRRMESGELLSAEQIKLPDSLKFYTKSGRIVYGSGGIIPDIFVAVDTLENDSLIKTMNRQNLFYRFAINYGNKHRKELGKKYPTPETFKKDIVADETIREAFSAYLKTKEKTMDWMTLTPVAKSYITNRIKANLGRILWDNEFFITLLNEEDPVIIAAMKALKENKPGEPVQQTEKKQ
jgi:carboxyl-terminal processing protease